MLRLLATHILFLALSSFAETDSIHTNLDPETPTPNYEGIFRDLQTMSAQQLAAKRQELQQTLGAGVTGEQAQSIQAQLSLISFLEQNNNPPQTASNFSPPPPPAQTQNAGGKNGGGGGGGGKQKNEENNKKEENKNNQKEEKQDEKKSDTQGMDSKGDGGGGGGKSDSGSRQSGIPEGSYVPESKLGLPLWVPPPKIPDAPPIIYDPFKKPESK